MLKSLRLSLTGLPQPLLFALASELFDSLWDFWLLQPVYTERCGTVRSCSCGTCQSLSKKAKIPWDIQDIRAFLGHHSHRCPHRSFSHSRLTSCRCQGQAQFAWRRHSEESDWSKQRFLTQINLGAKRRMMPGAWNTRVQDYIWRCRQNIKGLWSKM